MRISEIVEAAARMPSKLDYAFADFVNRWGEYVSDLRGDVPTKTLYRQELRWLERNLKGRPTLFRTINVISDWTTRLIQDHNVPVGIYWSMDEHVAKRWTGGSIYDDRFEQPDKPTRVMLSGVLEDLHDVDWNSSIASHMATNEAEVTLDQGARIRITAINGNPTNLLRKA